MGNCNDKRSQRTYIDPSSLYQTQIDRLQKGRPINVQEGLNVWRNSRTNKVQGVPIQWAKKYKLSFEVDMDKTVKTKHLPKQIRPSGELPKSITDFLQRKQGLGSKITNSSKISSVLSVDRSQKYKIRNLTSQLIQQFTSSQISQDIDQPQYLISLLSLQDQPLDESKHQSKLLTTNDFQKYLSKVQIHEQNPAQKYNFIEEIGKGSMCKVYKVTSKLNQLMIFAVKIIKLDQNRSVEKIKEEIAAMEMCASENIIDYHSTYMFKNSLFIFMDYMPYGSLTHFIQYFGGQIPQGIIALITHEILKGLTCIHNHWQIHRDLKSDNILISKDGQVKISDFGYALQFTKEKTSCKDVVGTPAWMAPQLITKKDYNGSVDIWSLGIIITELIYGQPKYLRMKPLKAMYMIVSQDPPVMKDASQQLRSFVSRCLQKDPQRRASIKQLMYDPFIRNVEDYQQQKSKFKSMLREAFNK